MIIIFVASLTNILAKEEQIIKYNLEDSRYLINNIFGNSKLSGIEVNIDKFGLKFIAINEKSSKNNKHVILSLSRDFTQLNPTASIYIGGSITLGDSTNPIIISPNSTISWPLSNLDINILGIKSDGTLVTTNGIIHETEVGSEGYNQIICSPNTPILINSKAPSSGDIIINVDPNTNGNIKLFAKNINLTPGMTVLAVDPNNNIITTENSLLYIGNPQHNYISVNNALNTFNSITNNKTIPDTNITLNGIVYMKNNGFLLPGLNQTTPLIIDSTGKIGILLSSSQYKTNIKSLEITTEAFNQLHPVSYVYKKDPQSQSEKNEFGFIAEEVHAIEELRSLVILDEKGNPLSINYHCFPAIIIGQIKQDREINKKKIAQLCERVEALEKIIKNILENK